MIDACQRPYRGELTNLRRRSTRNATIDRVQNPVISRLTGRLNIGVRNHSLVAGCEGDLDRGRNTKDLQGEESKEVR